MKSKIKLMISVLSVLLAFSLLLVSCSSSKKEIKTAIIFGDSEIGSDVYAYYLDCAMKNADEEQSEEDAQKLAKNSCIEYIKVNSKFKEMGLSLSSSTKASIATSVNNIWFMYGGYYKSIGVSKQTLTNVKESAAYKDQLISSIYGSKGEKEIAEADLKAYYDANYVFFKAINSYLMTTNSEGQTVPLSETDLDNVKANFESMRSQITGDVTIDSVNKAFEQSNGGSAEDEMPILYATKNTTSYPSAFFDDVSAMSIGDVKVLAYDTYIFLVQKADGSSYYSDYAKNALVDMTSKDFQELISTWYSDISEEDETSVQKSCYNTVVSIKGK